MNNKIYRQDVLDLFDRDNAGKYWGKINNDLLHEIWCDIESLPPAEPERKKGKWISRTYLYKSGKIEMQVCSECQYEYSYDAETGIRDANFCPNCGSDMRGEEV